MFTFQVQSIFLPGQMFMGQWYTEIIHIWAVWQINKEEICRYNWSLEYCVRFLDALEAVIWRKIGARPEKTIVMIKRRKGLIYKKRFK